ncbi:hypothetical protein CONCODRAFT_3619 [Conidiobolus coronatus NRRL 28638]|uniref:Peptide N-acetyl-beta-D-glucosaminyl asparaginase amidase A N-terminal domain-containing protein n=1 Tax=Conidiobolus coronatus (strain ATCC 28846 / CBS 209.66 / NRRL 28638) TaxID=796925 RepID=A0A137PEH4_CONC2|nr:hypothetical protein CONCODRAFT_3619 [Conidiobolus coronatus NRRL 28638]|eukprot:KXN73387.1 hypothetical protein CONCODRAFT_3619 [Conidiobolus coronatus NRRL 28638]
MNDSNKDNKQQYDYQSPFELGIIPIKPKKEAADVSVNLMHHEFKHSYYKPYIGKYLPDNKLKHKNIEQVILTWKGFSKGRQYDRIAGVWLDGVEILRTSTAEPTEQGIRWEFKVDVTRYCSLLYKERAVTVSLNNVVNEIYTASFLIDLSLEIYLNMNDHEAEKISLYKRPSDTIIGISQFEQSSEPWFTLENNNSIKFKLPQTSSNIQRAILEVFITGHGKEEYFQFNTPEDFPKESDQPKFGTLRELQISVNGIEAGVGWPFPVIFTGGVCPSLWRPISGIGSFSTDPIRFELSQFVGDLIKNQNNEIELLVSPSDSFWHVTGNLHLWDGEGGINNNSGMISSSDLKFPIFPKVRTSIEGSVYAFKTGVERIYHQKGFIDMEDYRIKVETTRKLILQHNLRINKDKFLRVYDFSVNTISETKFLKIPAYFGNNEEEIEKSGIELHKESHQSKWKFFGNTIHEKFDNNLFLINAELSANTVLKDHINNDLTKELKLNLCSSGKFGRRPNEPYTIDGSSEGDVSYWNKNDSFNQSYKRKVETKHGWVTADKIDSNIS